MPDEKPNAPKPPLQKRKAERDLKKIAGSFIASSSTTTSSPKAHSSLFSPPKEVDSSGRHEEPTSTKAHLEYQHLTNNIGKTIDNYFTYSLGAYLFLQHGKDAPGQSKPTQVNKRSLFANKKQEETGWKLHISVDPGQISAAWSVIYPILMEHKISLKIIDPEVVKRKSSEEIASKQFTIYQFKNKHIDSSAWLNIMQHIENALRIQGINKGSISPANKEIPHSDYFSYRNDTGPNGKYISDKAAEQYVTMHAPQLPAYNLSNAADPFATLSLQPSLEESSAPRSQL